MINDFSEVKMYECKWCKKLFKTNMRHSCKWNPAKHNCLTCKHCVGFKKSQDYEKTCYGSIPFDTSYFVCDLGRDDGGDWNEIRDLARYGWGSKCCDYETAECDDYRRHYAEKASEYERKDERRETSWNIKI